MPGFPAEGEGLSLRREVDSCAYELPVFKESGTDLRDGELQY